MADGKNVLGISCHYHDSAAALLSDGKVVAAAQEERFNREKYSHVFPIRAVNYCLQEGGLSPYDVDYIAFYEKPFLKLARTVIGHLAAYPFSLRNFLEMMPSWLDDRLTVPLKLKDELGFDCPVLFVKHHLAHAGSAFLVSPFDEAAILTVDGIGEWASTTWGLGRGTEISIKKELRYPDSLGLLYAIVTTWLGFRVFEGEGKVMALAGFGKPTCLDRFREVVRMSPDGSFKLDASYFSFNRGAKMYSRKFVDTFGPERPAGGTFEDRHRDVAASLQCITEEVLLAMARHVYEETKMESLCLAGGVFLNVLANTRILNETPFKRLFIHPAAGDAGAALGAAAVVYHSMLAKPRTWTMTDAFLGPGYTSAQIRRLLQNRRAEFRELSDEELVEAAAQKIDEGRIVAWFQGRAEWGPRALGHRSILADARNPDMKDILNRKVKHREDFRPYGISVLRHEMESWFELTSESPYMLLVGRVKDEKRAVIPSALHVDGTSRIQTVREEDGLYYKVVEAFHRRTGTPLIINTSLNVQGQPIVCTPEEAYDCYLGTELDCLAVGNFFLEKSAGG